MLITLDIGNTHIVTGLFDEKGNTLLTFRIATNDKMTEDEYFSYFRNITKFNEIKINSVNGIIISSVVPNLITIFQFLEENILISNLCWLTEIKNCLSLLLQI